MEETIEIKTKDGYRICGVLRRPMRHSDQLVVFVHGLFGRQNDHMFFNACKAFESEAFASFRFDFYGEGEGARRFGAGPFSQAAADLGAVLNHFSARFCNIYVVAHSLGAAIVLMSDLRLVARIVLWDPSRSPTAIFSGLEYSEHLQAYIFNSTFKVLLAKEFVEDAIKAASIKALLRKTHKPIKIITAGKGAASIGPVYLSWANHPKSISNIVGANHQFDEPGTEEQLYKETIDWLRDSHEAGAQRRDI